MPGGKELTDLISYENAVSKLAEVLKGIRLGVEIVGLLEAYGRILASDLYALVDYPGFDRSAVDGYAVRSIDTYGASMFNPARLAIVGEGSLNPGSARRVSTGEPIPEGADAVVMKEDVVERGGFIEVFKPVAEGSNISRKAEDFRVGERILSKGTLIDSRTIPIIAASGHYRIEVYERIRIGVVSIGSEIVEPYWGTGVSGHASLFNSTAYVVLSYLKRFSFVEASYYGIVPDRLGAIEDVVLRALELNDMVITTGGTGPGSSDLVYDFVERNGRWVFRGVAIRPGRPTSLSIVGGKPVLHLSGFPVAAWVGIEGLLRRALAKALGVNGLDPVVVYARLKKRLPNQAGYTSFIRTMLARDGTMLTVEPYMLRGSGLVKSLALTNSYIILDERSEGFEEGDIVEVFLDS
ncbi:molybdopterin molybdotransferase MoeA [Thermogladius sp. 4427co]|uniref:molybdopterin molybdotransferase MoeA n=1 Tax=Thermogladius sp. 4427co TaxID=3450718 RepID=UPI003F7AA55C